MSSQDTRWALELAIVDYDKAPLDAKDFIPVQHAITAHEASVQQEAYRAALEHPEDYEV